MKKIDLSQYSLEEKQGILQQAKEIRKANKKATTKTLIEKIIKFGHG